MVSVFVGKVTLFVTLHHVILADEQRSCGTENCTDFKFVANLHEDPSQSGVGGD